MNTTLSEQFLELRERYKYLWGKLSDPQSELSADRLSEMEMERMHIAFKIRKLGQQLKLRIKK